MLVLAVTEDKSNIDTSTATSRLSKWEAQRLGRFESNADGLVSEAVLYVAKEAFSTNEGEEIEVMISRVKDLAWVFFRTSHSTMIRSVVEGASAAGPCDLENLFLHREVSNYAHTTTPNTARIYTHEHMPAYSKR